MNEYWDDPRKQVAGVIPLHFNVPDHALPLRDFIETANQVEAIVKEISYHLFDGKLRYEVLILPP